MQIVSEQNTFDDGWQHLSDDTPWTNGDATVSLARWHTERLSQEPRRRPGRLGLRLTPGDSLDAMTEEDTAQFALVVLELTPFTDGRSFSQARQLREALNFQGEIRAAGDYLIDQVFFLRRVGVNTFEAAENRSATSIQSALNAFSVTYQSAVDQPEPLYRRNRR